MRPLMIGETEKRMIAEAIERARGHMIHRPEILERAIPVADDVTLADAAQKPPRSSKSEGVELPVGFLCAFSFEDQPNAGICRHLSISVGETPGLIPHPAAIQMIANAFGLKGSFIDETMFWKEEFRPGHWAVNLVWPDGNRLQ